MGKLSVHEGESLDKLRKVVGNGCKNLVAANHPVLEGYSFIVQEDTIISVLTVDGANATTEYSLTTKSNIFVGKAKIKWPTKNFKLGAQSQ